MLTLPTQFRVDLLAALRSGKYKRGITYMRSVEDEYCPLGVALDVLGVDWGFPEGPAYNPSFAYREGLINGVGFWPVALAMFDAGVLRGTPFPVVADWIEAHTEAT